MLEHPHYRVGQLPPRVGDLSCLAQHGGGQAVLCRDEQRAALVASPARSQSEGAIARGGEHHEGRSVLARREELWRLAELALGEKRRSPMLSGPTWPPVRESVG
ncbi:MAG: hypothetical protein QOI16_1761, partial [Pseudonocardiales bacterium]|nr:hypothetical protein [Pseudonocardiales bacterium]